VRTFITEYERLTVRVDELQNERECLQRQLAATNSRIDEVTELVEYVAEQRELERYRERRERMVD
jgi:prefoldin subunit 5